MAACSQRLPSHAGTPCSSSCRPASNFLVVSCEFLSIAPRPATTMNPIHARPAKVDPGPDHPGKGRTRPSNIRVLIARHAQPPRPSIQKQGRGVLTAAYPNGAETSPPGEPPAGERLLELGLDDHIGANVLPRQVHRDGRDVPGTLIFRIVGVVSALDHMVEPKGIYNPTSPGPPYCGYAAIWQEPRRKKHHPNAVRFWRCLYCLPTAQRQPNCSGRCGGTAGCFVQTAG